MNFSTILQAVREGWDFVWPPCVLVLVLGGLFWLIAPSTFKHFKDGSQSQFHHRRKLLAFLRLYGLKPFLPAMDAFAVLLILYVLQLLPAAIGAALPGRFVYYDAASWVETQPPADLMCALAAIPGATLDSLEQDIKIRERATQAKLGVAAGGELFSAAGMERQLSATRKEFYLCKFLILYSLVVAAFEIKRTRKFLRPLGLLVPVVAVLVLAAAYLAERQIYEFEQYRYTLLNDLQVIEDMEGFSCNKAAEAQKDAITGVLLPPFASTEIEQEPVIRVTFVDFYLKWLPRHLLEKRRTTNLNKAYFDEQAAGSIFSPDQIGQQREKTVAAWQVTAPQVDKSQLEQTASRLLAADYFLPAMVDKAGLLAGSVLYVAAPGSPLHYIADPQTALPNSRLTYPKPSPAQAPLCPAKYLTEVEQLDATATALPGRELTLLWSLGRTYPYVVTETVFCTPQDYVHAQRLAIGYKIARLW